MRVIGHTEFGGPDVLREMELPDPVVGYGEVLVRVRAAAVNPADTLRRSGAFAQEMRRDSDTHVPGMDVAGVLEAVGPGADTKLKVGDRVMAMVVPRGTHGAYSEIVALPADSVVRSPKDATDEQAATLPMNGLTAQMTLDALNLEPGRTLGVTGAAGAYGGYVVQLAKLDGLHVVVDASERDRVLVESLGADVIVDRGDDVAERFRSAVPGGLDAVADGAVLDGKVIGAVKRGGSIATVRLFQGDAVDNVVYHPIAVHDYARETTKLDRLRVLADMGLISLRVAATYRASEAAEAHRRLEAGGTRGRLVLMF